MPTKTVYARDDGLWNRAKELAGGGELSHVIGDLLGEWVRRQEALRSREKDLTEIELWVGGKDHQDAHASGRAHYVAFTGRKISTSRGKSLRQSPCIDVYLTKRRNLIVYTDWRESNEELGATFLRFRDFEALKQNGLALKTWWQDDLKNEPVERLDLEEAMLHEVADALGETLVIRID